MLRADAQLWLALFFFGLRRGLSPESKVLTHIGQCTFNLKQAKLLPSTLLATSFPQLHVHLYPLHLHHTRDQWLHLNRTSTFVILAT